MYSHIQRRDLQLMLISVARGECPYRTADRIIDIINENYDLKQEQQCMNCDAPLTEDHWKVCPSNPDNYHECDYTIFNSQTRVDDEGKYIQVMECECGNVKNFEMSLYS